jgi:hypothetical protein
MTAEIHNLPAPRSSTSGAVSQRNWSAKLQPAPVTETVALLTACLSLVKPVGMGAEDTQAWLKVAARELADMPSDLLDEGCQEARRTCTHHGQIVPCIIRVTAERLADRKRLAAPRQAEPVELLAHEPWRPSADELEAIKQQAAASLRAR